MHILVYGLSTDKMGGIESFLLSMNRFMTKNVIFDYIFEGTQSIYEKRIAELGGKSIFIAPKKKMAANIRDWFRLLRENRDTASIVYFNMYSLAWLPPVLISKMLGYKVVIHAHNNNLHDCGLPVRVLHKINRKIAEGMDVIRLTNSHLSAGFFFQKKSAEMIYNAIDTEKFVFNEAVRNQLRSDLNVQDKHIYGFAGRLAPSKNPEFLLDIFQEIQKLDSKAFFLVCGDGSLKDRMVRKAQDYGLKICFTGNKENIQDYYQAMDMFILPSKSEGLGLVLIEAQAAGLPAVTSADVVPAEAKVTELLDYLPLEASAGEWAELSVYKCTNADKDRTLFAEIVKSSSYDIRREAIHLEKALLSNTSI